jgi:hypothetical protein
MRYPPRGMESDLSAGREVLSASWGGANYGTLGIYGRNSQWPDVER